MKVVYDLNKFKWIKLDNVYIVGELLAESLESFAALLNKEKDISKIVCLLKEIEGFYSCIIQRDQDVLAFVDHVRSYPIFWKSIGDTIVITDNLVGKIQNEVNQISKTFFQGAMYTPYDKTLLEKNNQIPAGHYLSVVKDKVSIHRYWCMFENDKLISNEDEAVEYLWNTYNDVFDNLAKKNGASGFVVPLSGGHDSRLILFLMHKRIGNGGQLKCYNYGLRDEKDYVLAKKVADSFGDDTEFYHVDYTSKDSVKRFRSLLDRYIDFSFNYTSVPCVSELCAVSNLVEKGMVTKNDIIVPGYGGVVSGLYYKEKFLTQESYTKEDIIKIIVNLFVKSCSKEDFRVVCSEIQRWLSDQGISNGNAVSMVCALHLIQMYAFEEEQAKFIQNATETYDFFDIRWFTPFMTKKILKAWSIINPQLMKNDYVLKKLEKRYYTSSEISAIPFVGSKESYENKNRSRIQKYINPYSESKYSRFIPLHEYYYILVKLRECGINPYVKYRCLKKANI